MEVSISPKLMGELQISEQDRQLTGKYIAVIYVAMRHRDYVYQSVCYRFHSGAWTHDASLDPSLFTFPTSLCIMRLEIWPTIRVERKGCWNSFFAATHFSPTFLSWPLVFLPTTLWTKLSSLLPPYIHKYLACPTTQFCNVSPLH